jgi:hypothetical protein
MAITTVNSYLTASGLNFREGTTGKASLLLDPSSDKINLSGDFNLNAGSLTIGGNAIVTGTSAIDSDTLATVTARGASTSENLSLAGNITVGDGKWIGQSETLTSIQFGDGTIGNEASDLSFVTNADGEINFNRGSANKLVIGSDSWFGTDVRIESSDPILKITDSSTSDNTATLWLQESDSYGVKINYESHGDPDFRQYLSIDTFATADDSNQIGDHLNVFGVDIRGNITPHKGATDGNLLTPYEWDIYSQNSGSTYRFNQNGDQNTRVLGLDPHGDPATLWRAGNDVGNDADGGWNTDYFEIDRTKTYRSSVWVKKDFDVSDGNLYMGTAYVDRLTDGNYDSNPYWLYPQAGTQGINSGEWYLFVGYIYPSGTTPTSSPITRGGIYNRNGEKLLDTNWEFRWTSSGVRPTIYDTSRQRVYNYYDTGVNNVTYWWQPRFEPVEADTPSLRQLLDSPSSQTGAYFMGKVGIGTDDPASPLSVVGTARIDGSDGDAVLTIANSAGSQSLRIDQNSLRTTTTNDLTLFTNGNTSQLVLDQGGNVGIGTNAPTERLEVAPDTDVSAIIGKAHIGDVGHADYAGFAHVNKATSTNYGIIQRNNGQLNINSPAGVDTFFCKGGTIIGGFNTVSDFYVDTDTLYVDASADRVGIGTTGPVAKLHIKDSTDPPEIRLEDAAGGTQTAKIVYDQAGQNSLVLSTQYQSANDSNVIQFAPADSVAMTIRGGTSSNNGNVGIGSTTPAYKLDVAGDIQAKDSFVTVGFGASDGYQFHDLGTGWGFKGIASPTRLGVLVQGIESMTWESNGRVGIGSTNPASHALEVNGTISGDKILGKSGVYTYGKFGSVEAFGDAIYVGEVRTNSLSDKASNGNAQINFGGASKTIEFETDATARMFIAANGNVGIGIGSSAANQKFTVGARSNFDSQNNYYGAWIDGNTAGDSWVAVGQWYNVGGRMEAASNNLYIHTHNEGHDLVLQSGGANVGIGTHSPNKQVQIGSTDSNDVPWLRLQEDSSGGDKRLDLYITGAVGTIASEQSASQLAFRTTAGEAMRIDSNGNICIGNTSAGGKLDIHTDSSTTNGVALRLESSTGSYLVVKHGGDVGIGTHTPSYELDVVGTIHGTSGNFENGITINGNPVVTGSSAEDVDTLATVTSRGATTTTAVSLNGGASITKAGQDVLTVNRSNAGSAYIAINPSGGDAILKFQTNGTSNFAIGKDGTDTSFRIAEGGALETNPRFVIKNGGNIGIGLTDPDQALDVNGNIRIPNEGKIVFGSAGSTPNDYLELYDVGTGDTLLRLVQDGVKRFSVQGVNGHVYMQNKLQIDAGSTNTNTGEISFNTQYNTAFIRSSYTDPSASTETYLAFHANTDGAANGTVAEQMRIAGNHVGIGTTNPLHPLDVSGAVHIEWGNTLTEDLVTIKGGGSAGDYDLLKVEAANGDDLFTVGGYTYDVLMPDSDTNVGIGTTTASAKVHLNGPSAGFSEILRLQRDGGNYYSIGLDNGDLNFCYNGQSADGSTLVIDGAADSVGIGTKSPSNKLEVFDADGWQGRFSYDDARYLEVGYQGIQATYGSNNNNLTIATVSAGSDGGHIRFKTINTERARITNSGNFGIGVTDPDTPLHVKGNIRAEATASTSFADFKSSQIWAGSTYDIIVGTSNPLYFRTNDTRRMTIEGGGNVGIGITNPTRKLIVAGTAATDGIGVGTPTSPNGLELTSNGANYEAYVLGHSFLAFGTNHLNVGTTGSERMRITSAGAVGIGTSSPVGGYSLNVSGDIFLGDNSASTAGRSFVAYTASLGVGKNSIATIVGRSVKASPTTNNSLVTLPYSTDGTLWYSQGYLKGHTWHRTAGIANGETISESTGELMRLTTGGYLGIGITNPDNPVEISGSDNGLKISSLSTDRPRLTFDCGGSEKFILSTNSTYGAIGDSTDINRYMVFNGGNVGIGTNSNFPVGTAPAGKLDIRGASDGQLVFDSDGGSQDIKASYNLELWADYDNNNSAGYSNIIFKTDGDNTRMTIDNNGKVGIGNTQPSDTLQVAGQVRIDGSTTDGLTVTSNSGASQGLLIYNNSSTDTASIINYYDGPLVLGQNNAEVMRLHSDGNVGIGTTDPESKVHIYGGNSTQTFSNIDAGLAVENDGSSASHYVFQTATAGGGKSFSITNAGDVGIGVTNPDRKVVIDAGAGYPLKVNSTQDYMIGLARSSTEQWWFKVNTGGDFTIHENAADDRLRIKAGGNVGIGTASPDYKLTVDAGATNEIARFRTTDNDALISISDNTDTVYIGHDASADVMSIGFSNTVGSTSNVNIDTAGSVGIGTSNPASKLDVEGIIKSKVYAIGNLGSASPAGQKAFVNNASSAFGSYTIGASVTAAGSTATNYFAPVYSDGSYWRYG